MNCRLRKINSSKMDSNSKLVQMADELYRVDDLFCHSGTQLKESFLVLNKHSSGKEVLFLSGSSAEGCCLPRIVAKKEFESDIMKSRPLDVLHEITDIPGNLGYVYVNTMDTRNGEKGFVSPYSVRALYKDAFTASPYNSFMNGLMDGLFPGEGLNDFQYDPQVSNASTQLDLESGGMKISYDFVFSFRIPTWPCIANEWITRPRKWPPCDDVMSIVGMGCHVVPKSSPGGDVHKEWRYSFSMAELALVELQTEKQRRMYLIFKYIFYVHIKGPPETNCKSAEQNEPNKGTGSTTANTNPHSLHSFSAKTTFMWYLEQHPPDDLIWKDKNFERTIKGLIRLYLVFLKCQRIPNYFLRKQNIIENVSIECIQDAIKRIEDILDDFMIFVIDMETKIYQFTGQYDDDDIKLTKSFHKVIRESVTNFTVVRYGTGTPDVD